jgi:hypothetical protein
MYFLKNVITISATYFENWNPAVKILLTRVRKSWSRYICAAVHTGEAGDLYLDDELTFLPRGPRERCMYGTLSGLKKTPGTPQIPTADPAERY